MPTGSTRERQVHDDGLPIDAVAIASTLRSGMDTGRRANHPRRHDRAAIVACVVVAFPAVVAFSEDAHEPDSSISDWRAWQRAQVQRIEDAGFHPSALGAIVQGVHETAERSRDFFAQNPVAEECTANLRAFSRALWQANQPGHTLGLESSNRAYHATLPYPDLLELPPELHDQRFLKLLDDNTPQSLDAAVHYLESINARITDPERAFRYFVYQSQHLPTPDGTLAYGRFFVLVPGPSFDRYLQFGLRDDPQMPLPHGLSMVTIQKTHPDTGSPLRVPRAYLTDLWRVRENGKIIVGTRLEQTGHLENCYECHKPALLPIVPEPSTFDAQRWGRTLEEVNAQMSRHAVAEHAGLNRTAYGPGLGPLDSPLRTDAFLLSCAGNQVKPEDLPRLRSAMRCARCHDGENPAELDYPILLRELPAGGTLPFRYVVKYRKMPPGADLTDNEREALLRCLEEEYLRGFADQPGILSTWLAQPDCP